MITAAELEALLADPGRVRVQVGVELDEVGPQARLDPAAVGDAEHRERVR